MGLFNFFRNKNQLPIAEQRNMAETNNKTMDISRELSGEDKQRQGEITMQSSNGMAKGIEEVYAFLQADYESKGFNDAHKIADISSKSNGIKLIKLDLQILIKRVNNYYKNKIIDYDVHISSRSRAGLIDLVEKLRSEKEKAIKDMEEINLIALDIEPESGMVERIILSYEKGFMHGISEITQSKILS